MSNLDFPLHPKQWKAFTSTATEILYGGAAGSAKSHLMRVAAITWALSIPGLQIYLFRRTYDDLIKNHMEGPTGFNALLGPWLKKYVEIVDKEIRFNNGSKIYLCHCNHEKNRFDYLGAEIHVLLIDELTLFTETIYRFLRSRVRIPEGLKIPDHYKGMFPRILCGTNPGGIGHQFVRSTWIDPKPAFEIWKTPDDEGGFMRQFIPARLQDNPSIDQEAYTRNLSGLGSEALVKAMLEGDWDIVAGAALDIDRARHMIRPFKPLQHWVKFQVIDWGFVKPYAVGWFCVPDDDTLILGKDGYEDKLIPKGSLILYREMYGSTGKPDEGSREESDIVAKRIIEIEREANEHMDYRVADTAMWAKSDGPSIYERMYKATKGEFNPRQSIKDRQANYSEVCSRLKGFEFDKGIYIPMFYATSNCLNFWRTVPPLVLDDLHPEKGPDTDQEDHCLPRGTLIMTITGNRQIEEIKTGDMVLTTRGFLPCIQLGETSTQRVYDINFTDGDKVSCTARHKLLTSGGSYVGCDDLHKGDKLCVLSFFQKQLKSLTEKDFGFVENTMEDSQNKENENAFTGVYGNTLMEKYQKVCKYTIKTEIGQIIRLRILRLCLNLLTFLFTCKTRSKTEIGLNISRDIKPQDLLARPNGIDQKKEENGTASTQRDQKRENISSNVLFAKGDLIQHLKEQSSVLTPAIKDVGDKTIRDITRRSKKEGVWNLHIPGPNNYILANGIISHNCYDVVSYGCMSRPFIKTKDQRIIADFKRKRREHKLDNTDPYRIKPLGKSHGNYRTN